MSLTHITPDVIDLPKTTVALINDATAGGIRDYIDSPNITPTTFDHTTAIATTEFARNVSSFYPKLGGVSLTVNTTLSSTQAGRWFEVNAGGIIITLPAISTVILGSTYTFKVARDCTLKASGTEWIVSAGNGLVPNANTRECSRGETITVVANSGIGWYIISNGFGSDTFTNTQTANGYQKFPSGTILQWGYGFTNASNGSIDVTFPVAFPNACLNVSGNHAGGGGAIFVANSLTTTQFHCFVTTVFGGLTAVSHNFFWQAIGY